MLELGGVAIFFLSFAYVKNVRNGVVIEVMPRTGEKRTCCGIMG